MSAEREHKNHHESHVAYGTGGHTHHRKRMERGGQAVGYWACEKVGWSPCPDEPDPVERLLVKIAAASVPVVEPKPEPRGIAQPTNGWIPCKAVPWHGTTFKYLNGHNHQVCRACVRDRNRKARKAA